MSHAEKYQQPIAYIDNDEHLQGSFNAKKIDHNKTACRSTKDCPHGVVGQDFTHRTANHFSILGMDLSCQGKSNPHKKSRHHHI